MDYRQQIVQLEENLARELEGISHYLYLHPELRQDCARYGDGCSALQHTHHFLLRWSHGGGQGPQW